MSRSLIGTIQTLFIEEKKSDYFILTHDGQTVLLHKDETDGDLDVGDYVKVFLYSDDNSQIIATTTLPHIIMGVYGWATVVKIVPRIGLFVSIGTVTDVLVPRDHLPVVMKAWPNVEDKLYITLDMDRQGRLLGIPATETEMETVLEFANPDEVNLNEMIEGIIYFTSKEGAVMLTEKKYRGFIHHTERNQEPRLGESVTGRVIEVKEDGTLNVSLLPLKHERIDDDAELILNYLVEQDGKMPFNDRSLPADIRETFGMSKSAFKRALGRLMRERKVNQNEEGSFLTKEQDEE